MNETEFSVFESLFLEAVKKCFGHELREPLSETESKLFYNKLLEDTGLVIGWKSLKNYSIYILDKSKPENPSVPTLDTLARYVKNAPYTDEINRKEKESHYPYWFDYKNRILSGQDTGIKNLPVNKRSYTAALITGATLLLIVFVFLTFKKQNTKKDFSADFNNVIKENENGWMIKGMDNTFWIKRNQNPGYLTLYTLKGDNWPDTSQQPIIIKNLVYRKINNDCFTAEVHIKEFVPQAKWQQAGILLMEDSTLSSKSIRLSIGYNDNFGGYKRSPEFILQGISSSGKNDGKPEEFIHYLLFAKDSIINNPILLTSLNNTSLRIEKKENQFRFLYAGGTMENGAYHEITTKAIDINPRYIGIFALKGFVDDTLIQAVKFKSFAITGNECR